MTQELTTPLGHINADRAERMTAWWPRSLESQISNRTDRDQITQSIPALLKPCDKVWLMARVLALLTPYFTANVPEGVRVLEAEDWRASLYGYPQWMIEKACRWWKSDENPHRHRKPVEGDILERIKIEHGIVSFGAMKVREFDAGHAKRMAEPEREAPTPEEMAQRREFAQGVMARVGYANSVAVDRGPRRETVTDEDKAEMAAMLGAAK